MKPQEYFFDVFDLPVLRISAERISSSNSRKVFRTTTLVVSVLGRRRPKFKGFPVNSPKRKVVYLWMNVIFSQFRKSSPSHHAKMTGFFIHTQMVVVDC
jgi:hypothetical protein